MLALGVRADQLAIQDADEIPERDYRQDVSRRT